MPHFFLDLRDNEWSLVRETPSSQKFRVKISGQKELGVDVHYTMDYYAGIDVSLESASVCVVETSGKIVREGKVTSEPAALIAWFGSLGFALTRICR